MSRRSTFSAAFLGGLVGSNRPLQRAVYRYAKHLLQTVLSLPLLVMMRLGVPFLTALRLTFVFWLGLLGWLVVVVVARKLVPWVHRATAGRRMTFRAGRATWVYWLFDSSGLFLYVGVAYDVAQRMTGHSNDKAEAHWWWRVDDARTITRRYTSREEALAVETAYIKAQRELPQPMYNRAQAAR